MPRVFLVTLYRALALTVALGLALPWAAFADTLTVQNVVATGGDAALPPGATGQARFFLRPVDPADAVNGCNAAAATPVRITVTSSDPGKVTIAAPGYVDVTGCGEANAQSIAYTVPASAGSGTVTIAGLASGGKTSPQGATPTYHPNPATFNVTVAGDTTKPVVGVAGVPGGWTNASPVNLTISATDNLALNSISYSLDGAPTATTLVSGVAASVPLIISANGTHTLSFWAKDAAGNLSATSQATIRIDTQAPTLTGAPITAPNAAGWYNGNVTIHWVAQDQLDLAGVNPATMPADSVITGEGSNLGAGPVGVADHAGNTATASVGGIKIDRGRPTISGQVVDDGGAPRGPNAAGWYNSAVRVRFTCLDPLLADGTAGSGLATCEGDMMLTSDGVNQAVDGAAVDRAGNAAVPAGVTGIDIDSQAPQTQATNACTGQNGWCRGQTATVVLTAADQPGLSGVKEIRYRVNDGPWHSAAGAGASISVPLLAKSGLATVAFFAVDSAGNSEPVNGVSLKYDNIAPTVTHTLTQPANAAGWHRASLTVHFDAQDDDAGSGVDWATVTPDVAITAETAGQLVSGQAADLAGNWGTDAVVVRLDMTAPTIAGAATTSPNAAGWYNGPVTVRFTCADALSGVATCPADITLTSNGSHQSVAGTAVDRAGNSASALVTGLNIDTVPPALTVGGVANGAIYTLGAVPAAGCAATDDGSGVSGGCTGVLTGGTATGVGSFTYTATAADVAGNVATLAVSFRVIYRFDGFLQPINDTAHQVGVSTSIFKAGSTVPAKIQLKDAAGTVVQAGSLPVWLTPSQGGPTSAPVDEGLYGETPTAGGNFQWDSVGQHYRYNWGTTKQSAGSYWRIGAKLDDGQVYYVNIGCR